MAEDKQDRSRSGSERLSSLARLIKNPISLVGLALAVVALANIIFLFLVDMVSTQSKSLHWHSRLHDHAWHS